MEMLGKRILDDVYVHVDALHDIAPSLNEKVAAARVFLQDDALSAANVVKISTHDSHVSFLQYPDFDVAPFPTLRSSWSVAEDGRVRHRTYERSINPPILHRKELLVTDDHPLRAEWQSLTHLAERLGLFDQSSLIGFKLNWERAVRNMGYELVGSEFLPLGNDISRGLDGAEEPRGAKVQRHLTALSRTNLSAPIQLLIRNGLLPVGTSVFDYGCGRGDDVSALVEAGYEVGAWDPHFRPEGAVHSASVVNLGFVINVIEDSGERAEALQRAFSLTKDVLSIGVMLYGATLTPGRSFADGYLTSKGTFQKYFSQDEFKQYLEHVLDQEAFLIAPGVAFVFANKDLEQAFCANRYRRKGLSTRLILSAGSRTRPRRSAETANSPSLVECARAQLNLLWEASLDLGRIPDLEEIANSAELLRTTGGFARAKRLLVQNYDVALLDSAADSRADDLRVYFALQHFARRPRYKALERRLQRDIKQFFGDYKSALSAGLTLLTQAAVPERIFEACRVTASEGLGWLDEDNSLQLHASLVDRLPAVLRVYVACGLQLYGELDSTDLVKIHVRSGKLSLLEFDDFFGLPLPRMLKRVKVNLRELDYELFEYLEPHYPPPILYRKSRYMHEEMESFAEQLSFDEELERVVVLGDGFGPSPAQLEDALESKRLAVGGLQLVPSNTIPHLDSRCGAHLKYRDLIECGETQNRLGLRNLPSNPATYNALHKLATELLDPIIDYYGSIRLTFGFCSADLARCIPARIAPKLDQHAGEEVDKAGDSICERRGAACDFIVDDEDMYEVARWIIENVAFDRLYFYGAQKPLHLSHSSNVSRAAFDMRPNEGGRRIPRPFK